MTIDSPVKTTERASETATPQRAERLNSVLDKGASATDDKRLLEQIRTNAGM